MRFIAEWVAFLVASGVFIAMLISTWRHQASAAIGARRNRVELLWSLIPWVIVALCMAPSAFALASIGQRGVWVDSCRHLGAIARGDPICFDGHMPNTNRPAPDARCSSPHDYRRALQKAIAWMGDRYLLAVPLPRTDTDSPKYWTAPQHAAAYQSRQARR
jgi:hypothetical protein